MNSPMLPKGTTLFIVGSPEFTKNSLVALQATAGVALDMCIDLHAIRTQTPADVARVMALAANIRATKPALVILGQPNQSAVAAFSNAAYKAETKIAAVVEAGYPGPAVTADIYLHIEQVKVQPQGFTGEHINNSLDVIADVHGCFDTLQNLLQDKGYTLDADGLLVSSHNRIPVFVGDTVDKGPQSAQTLLWLYQNAIAGRILMVMGNHEHKLARVFQHNSKYELKYAEKAYETLEELKEVASPREVAAVAVWLSNLPHHLILHGGKVVVSHAGLPESLIGKGSPASKRTAIFGDPLAYKPTSGRNETTWEEEYMSKRVSVHGHTTVSHPYIRKNMLGGAVVSLDTGVNEGNGLASLSYPEMWLSVTPSQEF